MTGRTRRSRTTGRLLTVGRSAEVGMEPEAAGDWWTVCEDHGTLLVSRTKALALAATGLDFCDECRGEWGR